MCCVPCYMHMGISFLFDGAVSADIHIDKYEHGFWSYILGNVHHALRDNTSISHI